MTLSEFLSLTRPEWDWRTHDCCRWGDRWVQARGHRSPIEALELIYDSERSAMRRIAEGGGLVALWDDGLALCGVSRTDAPTVGDIGVIDAETDVGPCEAVAICTGSRWAFLSLRGLSFSDAMPVQAWAL